jgi:hypothetical protein
MCHNSKQRNPISFKCFLRNLPLDFRRVLKCHTSWRDCFQMLSVVMEDKSKNAMNQDRITREEEEG